MSEEIPHRGVVWHTKQKSWRVKVKKMDPENRGDPTLLDVATHLGYTLSLDVDGELVVKGPLAINVRNLSALLRYYRFPLARHIQHLADDDRCRFYGGPLDSRQHGRSDYGKSRLPRYWAYRQARAKWVVFQPTDDGRAIFRGWATSEKKGKAGDYHAEPAKVKT